MTAEIAVGETVWVDARDGHRFTGRVLEFRTDPHGQALVVLRLDTGWQVSYPAEMVRPIADDSRRE